MTHALDFDAYFSAVHGHPPFPWQRRLAAKVVEHGGWPRLLDLPTGVGKTAAIDVALFALAARPNDMPRRILLVVDRRIIVDQAAEHARHIRKALRDGQAPEVATQLRATFGGADGDAPFEVAVLRGGMPKETDWVRRPDRPLVALSTVDQVGSRLLFRGYGVSPRMAPIHAGLIGNDVLLLLDEVHLAIPFKDTLEQIADRWHGKTCLPRRFHFVQMSATPSHPDPPSLPSPASHPRGPASERFQLANDDYAHPELSRRLRARKPTRLMPPVKVRGKEAQRRRTIGEEAAKAARDIVTNGARCVGVVLNRVDSARHAWATLSNNPDFDAILVTGRMRELDRDRLVNETLRPRAGAGRTDEATPKPLVVVATQTIEAGADLDFDGLVTECASLDALKQRFGRLNRRGSFEATPARILIRSDQAEASMDDPVYGAALARTWQALREADKEMDLGVLAFPISAREELLAEKKRAPILLETHLDCWSQTSPIPEPDPDVSLWLHGPHEADLDIRVLWRSDVTEAGLEAAVPDHPDALMTAALAARPPRANEALSIPIHAVRSWLRGDEETEVADVVGTPPAEASDPPRRSSEPLCAVRWDGEEAVVIRDPTKLRPGVTVVVPCERGGLTAGNWDPAGREPVPDLGDEGNDVMRRTVLGLAERNLRNHGLLDDVVSKLLSELPQSNGDDAPAADEAIQTWWSDVHSRWSPKTKGAPPELPRSTRQIIERLGEKPRLITFDDPNDGRMTPLALRATAPTASTTEDDDSSFLAAPVTLRQHGADVKKWAARFVANLDLPETIAKDVRLAAWFHDVGKADPRFQRWLSGGTDVRPPGAEPLAKSDASPRDRSHRNRAQKLAGYPRGERHELLSVAMLERTADALAAAHDPQLVLHLVGSHHGWCRPFAPALDHPDDIDVELALDGITLHATTRHGAAACDSGIADRFWQLTQRYGWWGLAWLEALVRLADHRASEEVERS